MSHERARNRVAREREAGVKAAAKGAQQERRERADTYRQRQKQAQRNGPPKVASHKPTPRRPKGGHAPVGRPDGPLARRRRARTRLALVLLVLVNLAAWLLWSDWNARVAVLIVSLVTTPLVVGMLLRRR